MAALGYERYVAQGGDWGAIVCRALAKNHAGSCRAVHVNMCVAAPRLSRPWHLLTVLNVALAPATPVFLSREELEGVQVKGRGLETSSGRGCDGGRGFVLGSGACVLSLRTASSVHVASKTTNPQ